MVFNNLTSLRANSSPESGTRVENYSYRFDVRNALQRKGLVQFW